MLRTHAARLRPVPFRTQQQSFSGVPPTGLQYRIRRLSDCGCCSCRAFPLRIVRCKSPHHRRTRHQAASRPCSPGNRDQIPNCLHCQGYVQGFPRDQRGRYPPIPRNSNVRHPRDSINQTPATPIPQQKIRVVGESDSKNIMLPKGVMNQAALFEK